MWLRGDWGAYAAIAVGAIVPILFLFLEKTWRVPLLNAAGEPVIQNGAAATVDYLRSRLGPTAPHYTGLATFALTAMVMVVGSLLKPRAATAAGAERSLP